MKIPKQLKIGGHIYKIIAVEQNDLSDKELCAKINLEKLTITFDSTLPESQIEETIIHEIFHGLNTVIDHTLLNSLAHQLHQVLRDNNMLK